MAPACCQHDKFEACMMSTLGCYPMSSACTSSRQLQVAQFLSCFEGGKGPFQDGVCLANAQKCAAVANLSADYDTIMSCVNNDQQSKSISLALNHTCTVEPTIIGWPHVRVNGVLTCGDDSCMMPLLQVLCNAYPLDVKPASCNHQPFPPASHLA